eukprot:28605-Pelagomonas_calceolata.AAC.5
MARHSLKQNNMVRNTEAYRQKCCSDVVCYCPEIVERAVEQQRKCEYVMIKALLCVAELAMMP